MSASRGLSHVLACIETASVLGEVISALVLHPNAKSLLAGVFVLPDLAITMFFWPQIFLPEAKSQKEADDLAIKTMNEIKAIAGI